MENCPDMTLQNIRYAVFVEGRDKKLRCSMMLQQRPVLDMILSQFSAINIFTTCFTIIQFNIISHLSLLELSQVVRDWPHSVEVLVQSHANLYQMCGG
jgi:hypothetical protein